MWLQALGQGPAEHIAASAAEAAWAGAGASTLASVVALGVALWAARREEAHRRRVVADQMTAFCFAMIGGFEMVKPLIRAAQLEPGGETPRRRFEGAVEHARSIAAAGLGIPVFDIQMLRDAYLIQGLLNLLAAVSRDAPGDAIPHAAVTAAADPVLNACMDADARFFARVPTIFEVEGIDHSTPVDRAAA